MYIVNLILPEFFVQIHDGPVAQFLAFEIAV